VQVNIEKKKRNFVLQSQVKSSSFIQSFQQYRYSKLLYSDNRKLKLHRLFWLYSSSRIELLSTKVHCMKSGIFVSKRHCRLSWKFRFTTAHGNLQVTLKTAVNCRKLTWALLGSCPPIVPPSPKSRGGFDM